MSLPVLVGGTFTSFPD